MTARKSFFRDIRGNAATFFAFAAFPTIIMIGGVMDYTVVLKEKAKVQGSLDNSLLGATAHVLNEDLSDFHGKVLQERLKEYQEKIGYYVKYWMKANYPQASFNARDEDAKVRIAGLKIKVGDDGKVDAWVDAKVRTTVLGMIGIREFDVKTHSQVIKKQKVEQLNLEVALVLDVTGSMSGSKMDELKRSSKSFLKTLYDKKRELDRKAAENAAALRKRGLRPQDASTSIKVGIVPFSQYVNVGRQYRNASWIDVPRDRVVRKRVKRWRYKCRRYTRRRHCWGGWGDYPRRCATSRVCTGGWYRDGWYWGYSTRYYIWRGCVGSRDYPKNLSDGGYSADKVPGIQDYSRRGYYNYCTSAAIKPLTELTSAGYRELVRKIDSLRASGYTYIPSGLAWGMRVLSPQEPFTGGVTYAVARKKNVRKVVVLMTDGQNTKSPSYPDHDYSNRGVADRITTEMCNRIKEVDPATGMRKAEIITVAFDVTDPGIKNILRNCSTMGFFDAKKGGLNKVFKDIGMKLQTASLYISQ